MIAKWIQKNFWLMLIGSLLLGLAFPLYPETLSQTIQPALMLVIFAIFLKIKISDIFRSIQNYKLITYITLGFLIIIPAITFYLAKPLGTEVAIGLLLLTAMPAGTSAPALTDIFKGNTSLCMGITIITSILAPFTVPLILKLLTGTEVTIDTIGLFTTLASIILIPMALSQIAIKLFPKQIKAHKDKLTPINILILCFIAYTIIGSKRDAIIDNPSNSIWLLLLLFITFFALHLFSYFIAIKLKRQDKIAVITAKSYMNNAIGMVIAAKFFGPTPLIILVLSSVPWTTLPGVTKKIISHIK